MSLTRKQRRFVREYVKDLNGTQAAVRAGYSAKTAQVQSSRLLSNVTVQAEIQEHTAKHFAKLDISAEHVLQELAAIAFADVTEPIRPAEKLRALELLGKYHGLFNDHIGYDVPPELRADVREMVRKAVERHLEPPEPPHPHVELSILSDEEFREWSRLLKKCTVPPPTDVPVNEELQ